MARAGLKAVQTRLPADLARDVANRAEAEGLDTSNWIRRLITLELRPRAYIDGWMRPKGSFPPDLGMKIPIEEPAEFHLLPTKVTAITDGLQREFVIYEDEDRPLRGSDAPKFAKLDAGTHHVILRGSGRPWRSLGQFASHGRSYITLQLV